MLMEQARQDIIDYCLRMTADELTLGTSGNISVRDGDQMAITPSGVDYDKLSPEMICVLDMQGRLVEGDLKPSTEVPMHQLIYDQTDATAVIHTHPLYGTALGLIADETPVVHYMLASCGGPVRVAEYATFGSAELASNVRMAMTDRTAVLLRNHGATCWGTSLKDAYTKASYLEWCCKLYLTAAQVGRPRFLNADQFDEVLAKLGQYGKQPSTTK